MGGSRRGGNNAFGILSVFLFCSLAKDRFALLPLVEIAFRRAAGSRIVTFRLRLCVLSLFVDSAAAL